MVWTSEQLSIIERPASSTVVIASPGSGKTTVLTSHIEHVLMNGKVAPSAIAAVTFTRQAAYHMREKLKNSLKISNHMRESLRIGTFHAQMFKALLSERSDIPVLLNAKEQRTMMKRALERVRGLEKSISETMITYYLTSYSSRVGSQDRPLNKLERAIFESYTELKDKFSRWDYEDILLNAVRQLQCAGKLRYIESLRYLLVDEFQDTNALQWIIVSTLHHRFELPIFVVGDDDQAIYGFRGSSPQFLQNSAQHLRTDKIFLLSQNFRSDQCIIDCSSALISHAAKRITKRLRGTGSNLGEAFAVQVRHEQEEVQCVLEMLTQYHHDPSIRSVGVLARTRKQLYGIWTQCQLDTFNKYWTSLEVQFRTFHDSKGKEWDMVILLDMVATREKVSRKPVTRRLFLFEEERRLCYVGLTRARHVLIAIVPETINHVEQRASPFLAEAKLPTYKRSSIHRALPGT